MPREAVAIAEAVEPGEKKEAKKRQQSGKDESGQAGGRGKKKNPTAKSEEGLGESAKRRER